MKPAQPIAGAPVHDAGLYLAGNPYQRENILMGERYADYVLEESAGCQHFLELGIGFGKTVERLSHRIPHVTVVDAEPRLIEEFRPRYPSVSFVQQFFDEFATSQRFCGIGMGFVLDLVKDPLATLTRYAGFLKPGGRIFVSVENARSLHRRIAHQAGLLADIRQMSDFNKGFGHQCYKDHEEWLALFDRARLKTRASYGLYLKPFSTGQLDAMNLSDDIYAALSHTARDLPAIANACLYVLEV
jgi:trans-aconitate methyltransferase